MSMEFTKDGLEIPVDESMGLLRLFGCVVHDVELFYGRDHPETDDIRSELLAVEESARASKAGGSERVIFPREQIRTMVKLAKRALESQCMVDYFCEPEDDDEVVFRSDRQGDAHRALAMAADISLGASVNPASNELARPDENPRRLNVVV